MELMSSLLLCVLVALLPRTLGISPSEIKIDDLKLIGKSSVNRKTVLLNSNFPLVSLHSDLQTVFNDLECSKCLNCMERAIKAHKVHTHLRDGRPNTEDLANDVLESYHQYKSFRNKREADEKVGEKTVFSTAPTIKKTKLKNNKSVTVTKYSISGQVYALKINEGGLEDASGQEYDSSSTACQVYSVKKYFPCGSPEGDSMLISAKRKAMRAKRDQPMKTDKLIATTEKAKSMDTVSKAAKRQVDNAQILEHYMTSVEELY